MKAKEYEAIVEDCRKSGLTIKAYCEREGIPVETMHTWIRRTRQRHGIRDDRKTYEEYRAIVVAGKPVEKQQRNGVRNRGSTI